VTIALVRVLFIAFTAFALDPGFSVAADKQPKETREGLASFIGKTFQGDKTASGETFDKNHLVAAHPSYPFGTRVRVTNLENMQVVEVRISDRGPSAQNRKEGVIIDLSHAAAEKLGFIKDGRVKVRTEVLEWGEPPR
jgi:rare lipoprotein A